MPLDDPVYIGVPPGDPANKYLQGRLEHHWKNLVKTTPDWNATEILIFVYLGKQYKWNQLSSNNSRLASCIHKGAHAGSDLT